MGANNRRSPCVSQSIAGGIVHQFGYHADFYFWRA
jgi:hypothetical protein